MDNIDQAKPLTSSRTFWFNLVSGAAAVASAASGVLPPPAMPWVMGLQALCNIALRFITSQPVTVAGR